jgi:hypothetical protein
MLQVNCNNHFKRNKILQHSSPFFVINRFVTKWYIISWLRKTPDVGKQDWRMLNYEKNFQT